MPQNKIFGLLGSFACLKGLESSLWIGYFWSCLFDISIQPFPLNVAATWFPLNLSSWHILEKKKKKQTVHSQQAYQSFAMGKRLVENWWLKPLKAIGWKSWGSDWLKKGISWPSKAIIGLGISLCGQANRLSFASAVGWDWIAAAAPVQLCRFSKARDTSFLAKRTELSATWGESRQTRPVAAYDWSGSA